MAEAGGKTFISMSLWKRPANLDSVEERLLCLHMYEPHHGNYWLCKCEEDSKCDCNHTVQKYLSCAPLSHPGKVHHWLPPCSYKIRWHPENIYCISQFALPVTTMAETVQAFGMGDIISCFYLVYLRVWFKLQCGKDGIFWSKPIATKK